MLHNSKRSVDPCVAKLSLEEKPDCSVKIYTLRERTGSNCRGKQGKTALDQEKLKAIFTSCMQHFPLKMQLTADKEMCNAVDKVCRKSKTTAAAEPENA